MHLILTESETPLLHHVYLLFCIRGATISSQGRHDNVVHKRIQTAIALDMAKVYQT